MINEEKAREYQAFIESNNPSAEAYGFYNAYLSACEWKDKQYKGYMEKIIDKTQHQAGIIFRDIMKRRDDYSALDEDFMRKVLRERMQEIIKELFKEN